MRPLQKKLLINRQKNQRRNIIESLDEDLAKLFRESKPIFGETGKHFVQSLPWPPSAEGEDQNWNQENLSKWPNWKYEKLDNWKYVLHEIFAFSFPEKPCQIWFGDEENPVFEFDDTKGIQSHLADFLKFVEEKQNSNFAIVGERNAFGLLVTHYIGYLQASDQKSDKETVYEVCSWYLD